MAQNLHYLNRTLMLVCLNRTDYIYQRRYVYEILFLCEFCVSMNWCMDYANFQSYSIAWRHERQSVASFSPPICLRLLEKFSISSLENLSVKTFSNKCFIQETEDSVEFFQCTESFTTEALCSFCSLQLGLIQCKEETHTITSPTLHLIQTKKASKASSWLRWR